jgi:hypothetical protein
LIIGCSQTKISTPGDIPAIERYDGPAFRVLRRFLANGSSPHQTDQLDVFILSAEYGLIGGKEEVPIYDRRMTQQRAGEIHDDVLSTFKQKITGQNYTELFLSMGKTYLLALDGFEELLPSATKVKVSRSTSGRKLTELKAWLTGQKEPVSRQLALPLDDTDLNGRFAYPVRGKAHLKGVELAAPPEEIYEVARQALAIEAGKPHNFKDWYVLVDEQKVAPQWLVSQLSGVPVSQFDAGAARRVLNALGVSVYPNK